MSRVDDLIDQLGGAYYITTMDLTRGYWQVPVSEDAKQKTAFATPFGLYQFNRMPFGLKGASATFQRLVDRVLRNLESVCGAYIDNLIILSKLWEKHVSHIRAVLERLKGAGLTAKPSKCCFETTSCTYLGHVVGSGAVRPEPSKVHACVDLSHSGYQDTRPCVLGTNWLLSALHSKLRITGHSVDRLDEEVCSDASTME
eukprot:Em0009g966a